MTFDIPKGWTRGNPLRSWQKGERVAVMQTGSVADWPEPDDIAIVEFDTREQAQAFVDWWHGEPK